MLFGIIIFAFDKGVSREYLETHNIKQFESDTVGQDKVALLDEGYESGLVRINLIENATDTLDIAYYRMDNGTSMDIFLGSIIDAADRGVKVRLIIDGLFYTIKNNLKYSMYEIANHPNIEFKLFNPFKISLPSTWNNRLHDKIIIVDNKLVMTGGRNIGNRYFSKNIVRNMVNDKDVVVLNTDINNIKNSVISESKAYFNYIWDSPLSKYRNKYQSVYNKNKASKKLEDIRKVYKHFMENNKDIYDGPIDWESKTVNTNKVSIIYNQISMYRSEPWCWAALTKLANNAKESVVVQSPYIVPTNNMIKYIDKDIKNRKVEFWTNSLSASPNLMAFPAYQNKKRKIIKTGVDLYEYQGSISNHAKVAVFDKKISAIGSFNFDARSAYLNTESMMIIDSKEFAKILDNSIRNINNKPLKVIDKYKYEENKQVEETRSSLLKRLIIRILSIPLYIFDFLV